MEVAEGDLAVVVEVLVDEEVGVEDSEEVEEVVVDVDLEVS